VPKRVRNWLTPAAWVAATTAVLLLLFPVGFPNYDTIYALVWGKELAHGMSIDYGAVLPPTPHPLADLLGLVTTPLGDGAIGVTMAIAYLSLGLIGYLVYRLGSLWFDRPIGVVAALIVLSRAPYLSNGLRAYVDLPYIALVLGALTIETRRRRAGWPVLALLALAGLLRPEAWLFSFAYLAYFLLARSETSTAWGGSAHPEPSAPRGDAEEEARALERADTRGAGLIGPALVRARGALASSPRRAAGLVALTLAAPLCWALFDWITAGDPLHSFTGTRQTVDTLARQTGPVDLVLYGPRRLGEVLQWPGMVGAAGGIALGLAFLRRRSAIGVAAAALALGAFAIVACGGLAILPRYTMLAGAVLAIFVSLSLLGWRLLEPGHPWRRPWGAFAAFVALMFVVWGPNQYDLLHQVDVDLTNQGGIESDLTDLARSGAFDPLCGPISVPNHRAVPRLAFNLDIRPSSVVSSSEQRQPRRGYFLKPASPFVIHNFILDPNDPSRFTSTVPPGFQEVARNESWVLYRRC
jgi:hypothetical protein